MRPDRIAVYSYAHVPWLRPHQKGIDAADLPDRNTKFELIGSAIDTFSDAGYDAIGMDHFALPQDDLAVAARERRLHRNFMGYTTRRAGDMLGVGVSAQLLYHGYVNAMCNLHVIFGDEADQRVDDEYEQDRGRFRPFVGDCRNSRSRCEQPHNGTLNLVSED